MSERKHVTWFTTQLPILVSTGVLAPEVADRLRQHYSTVAGHAGRHWGIVLCSLLGTLCIGSGVILVLAHNWEELSRPVRAGVALALLLGTQVLAGWVLWRRPTSTAWREGAGTCLSLMIGASLALVSQTYHLGGDLGTFMLTWVLLGLPVAYLLHATVPALLYLVGIVSWLGTVPRTGWLALGYWPLVGALLPYLWYTARAHRYHARPVLLCWGLAVTLPIACARLFDGVLDNSALAWLLLSSAVASVWYQVGARWWPDGLSVWQRPWQTLGGLGVIGLALLFSFLDVWPSSPPASLWRPLTALAWPAVLARGLLVGWLVAALGLWVESLWQRDVLRSIFGALPLLGLGVYALAPASQMRLWGVALCNAYLLLLGLMLLTAGLRQQRLGLVNGGMLLITGLLLSRFVDAGLDFALRGVAFIVLGSAFLATNLLVLRRKGERP